MSDNRVPLKNMKTLFYIKQKVNLLFFFKIIFFKIFIKLNKKNKSNIKIIYNKDFISQTISIFGTFEKETLELTISFLKKNFKIKDKNVIDIGSNIGNHSIFFSTFFKKVYSFEPHPLNFKICKLNTENFKNIEVFDCALGNKIKKDFLFEDPIQSKMGGHSMIRGEVSKKVR